MAWFSGKVSLGNFPDLAGAVNKLSESVKNIEKNFDNALGLEEKSEASGSSSEGMSCFIGSLKICIVYIKLDNDLHCAAFCIASRSLEISIVYIKLDSDLHCAAFCIASTTGLWPSTTDRKALFEPIMGFMGQKGDESTNESLEKTNSSEPTSPVKEKQFENDGSTNRASDEVPQREEANEEVEKADIETKSAEEIGDSSGEQKDNAASDHVEAEVVSPSIPVEVSEQKPMQVQQTESADNLQVEERSEEALPTLLESSEPESTSPVDQDEVIASIPTVDGASGLPESIDEKKEEEKDVKEVLQSQAMDASPTSPSESRESSAADYPYKTEDGEDNSRDNLPILQQNVVEASEAGSDLITRQDDIISKSVELKQHSDHASNVKEQRLSSASNSSDLAGSVAELEKVRKEMKMMETALQGAARQAQAKADEIAKMMNENEQLKSVIDDLRRKTNEAEIESLREEYHQRVAALERKVYALTRERDTLRREQSKKSDAAVLLKEKDEIISQVMAEGTRWIELTRIEFGTSEIRREVSKGLEWNASPR
ncbi:hypothetical protein BUALT_Bualt07G0144900 [Buddleja alternifolia]|uniref:Golgin candidate 5 n=1 Tax=Buddleja alternifolia TaxID=168488 RepID=A0AAV6XF40_9LAMI|nr:hypothetical protein BUALT_Bualt07G0144900 [Buddleja alternifolia]